MNFREQLRNASDHSGKWNYEYIKSNLRRAAEEGKTFLHIDADNVISSDMDKLIEEGLDVKFLNSSESEEWRDTFDCWLVEW